MATTELRHIVIGANTVKGTFCSFVAIGFVCFTEFNIKHVEMFTGGNLKKEQSSAGCGRACL